MTTDVMTIRRRVVESARWAVTNKKRFEYAEIRPIPLNGIALGRGLTDSILPVTTDCSGFVTMCAKAAGAPDPNGLGYDGQGFTGDLLRHLKPAVERSHTWRGDLVVFGPGTGDHVAVLLEGGSHVDDPKCASHGSSADPSIFRLSELIAFFQGQPVRYLRLIPDE
jgi:cell wall-associated NlpC family hydrolase